MRMANRKVSGQATNDRSAAIRQAALKVFFERGYSAATIEDIAQRAGILKGSLYYYINSKEDLLFQLILEVHRFCSDLLEQVDRLTLDPVQKCHFFIRAHLEYTFHNMEQVTLFYQEHRALTALHHAQIVGVRRRYEEYLVEIITSGQKAGFFFAEADPWVLCYGVLGLINWPHQWYFRHKDVDAEATIDTLVRLALEGLRQHS